jgi:hypothetical protein
MVPHPKSILFMAGLAAAVATGAWSAEANTHVNIGIGVPYGFPIAPGYGAECFGHGYRYCWPGGYYRGSYPSYYLPRRPYRVQPVYRLSCGQVRALLAVRGWHRLRARDCAGTVYRYTGWLGGRPFAVNVSSMNGRVLSRRAI